MMLSAVDEWTKGGRLERLAAFAPLFRDKDASFGTLVSDQVTASGLPQMPYYAPSELGLSFLKMLYDAGWVLDGFSWPGWAHGEEAQRLVSDRAALAEADETQLAKLLTGLARQDRFVEGALGEAFSTGLLLAITERAETLRATLDQDGTRAALAADIAAAPLRYIKLGRGGAWAERALKQGEIHLGHSETPHEIALSGERAAVVAHLARLGRGPGKAADFAREILDFYTLPEQAIWITFEGGYLWWAQASCEVIWLGEGEDHGLRMRRTLRPWRNTDLDGRLLRSDSLSTRLTKVAAYRQTLCGIEAEAYLRRKLAGEEDPLVAEAMAARGAVLAAGAALIAALHWADFETLVDLLLSRGGWHRTSALGGTMKDADLLVEQAVTGETALVQVKSAASQATLDDYLDRFDAAPSLNRLIFVCHSPKGTLAAPARPDVTLWTKDSLAEAAIRNGLFDWLVARAA